MQFSQIHSARIKQKWFNNIAKKIEKKVSKSETQKCLSYICDWFKQKLKKKKKTQAFMKDDKEPIFDNNNKR